MEVKEHILAIIGKIDFEEYLEEKDSCPTCHEESLIRHISKEPAEKWTGKWFVEYCTEEGCPYWTCGFLPASYRPKKPEEYITR